MSIMEDIVDSVWESNHGMSIPRQRFFQPINKFWDVLQKIKVERNLRLTSK